MGFDVDAWWGEVRSRVAAFDQTGNRRAPAFFRARLSPFTATHLESRLREMVAPHLPPGTAAARVVLPPTLARYFAALFDPVVPVMWSADQIVPELLLRTPSSIAGAAQRALESPDFRSVDDVGVWIELTHEGLAPRHRFLCCDPTRAEYGLLGVTGDAHPWWDGVGCLDPLVSFEAWLADLQSRPLRPRDPVVLALTGADLAELAEARAGGDLRAVVSWVRTRRDAQMPAPPWSTTEMASRASEGARVVRDRDVLARLEGEPLCASEGVRATLLSPGAVARCLGALRDAPPVVAPGAVSAWTGDQGFCDAADPAGALLDLCQRAVEADHSILWVLDDGTRP